jgi:hypothetical protein
MVEVQYGSNKSGILKRYNVLLLLVRSWHSKSLKTAFKQNYTFSALANDIQVLDFLKLKIAFCGDFVGNDSRQLAEMYPHRVESMIFGSNLKMNFQDKCVWVTHSSMFCLIWFYTDSLPL